MISAFPHVSKPLTCAHVQIFGGGRNTPLRLCPLPHPANTEAPLFGVTEGEGDGHGWALAISTILVLRHPAESPPRAGDMLRIAPLFSWPSCVLVGEPLPDGADVACGVASLPCPGQQHVCWWLQVDGVGGPDLCCELVTLLLAGAAADDPCCALGHGGDVVQAVGHRGRAPGGPGAAGVPLAGLGPVTPGLSLAPG